MSARTILLFPEFENRIIIDEIREKYDPLAHLIRPHITLVFPFESPLRNAEIADILENRLTAIKPFEIILHGIRRQADPFGNYLFLDVKKGAAQLCDIHRILYDHEFREYDFGLPYSPHLTIGKFPTKEALNQAYEETKNLSQSFQTVVDKVSVEMIGEEDESIIVIEKQLR